MAQAGYTPILIYASGTATNIPTAGNLISGSSGAELAINYADGKLYYKDGSGNVKLLSIGYGSSSVTPTNGGVQYGTGTALALTAAGSSGQILRSNGAAAPTWADLSTLGVNTISFGTTGLTPNSATAGAVTVAGTLVTANGGTGLGGATPFTANGVLYASSASALTSGSALTFDGTTFAVTNASASLALSATKSADGNTAFFRRVGGTYNPGMYISLSDTVNNEIIFNTTYSSGNAPAYVWQQAGSESMRLASTGLGIGTSSPAYKLDVAGADLRLNTPSGTAAFRLARAGTNKWAIYNDTSENLHFYSDAAGLDRAILDSSGNLGLGVTPSAWGSSWRAFEMNGFGLMSNASNPGMYLMGNAYYNGTNYIYKATAAASNYTQTAGEHKWFNAPSGTAGNAITFTQAMTLDASGNLGVGETSPSTYGKITLKGGKFSLVTDTAAERRVSFWSTANGNSENAYIQVQNDGATTNTGEMLFATKNSGGTLAERARITSGGYFKASNDGTYVNSTGTYYELRQTANQVGLWISSTNANLTNECLYLTADRNTTNNSFYAIAYFNNGAAAAKFRVADSGDVTNTNGTYGTISDAKMKTDIVDAGSQWADVKAIRFRKFKMKDDPSGLLQLGVVAQELEQTSPGLVDEHVDRDADGNDLGTTTKSVKTSILLMKAAKALQEAMARIETLEAKVSALEGN